MVEVWCVKSGKWRTAGNIISCAWAQVITRAAAGRTHNSMSAVRLRADSSGGFGWIGAAAGRTGRRLALLFGGQAATSMPRRDAAEPPPGRRRAAAGPPPGRPGPPGRRRAAGQLPGAAQGSTSGTFRAWEGRLARLSGHRHPRRSRRPRSVSALDCWMTPPLRW